MPCFLSGASDFKKNLAHQKTLRAALSPFAIDSSTVLFSQQFPQYFPQQLLICVWDGRMVSQVRLGYAGLVFQQFVPAWVLGERRAGRKHGQGSQAGCACTRLPSWAPRCRQGRAAGRAELQAGLLSNCSEGLVALEMGTFSREAFAYRCLNRHLIPQRSTRLEVAAAVCMGRGCSQGCPERGTNVKCTARSEALVYAPSLCLQQVLLFSHS